MCRDTIDKISRLWYNIIVKGNISDAVGMMSPFANIMKGLGTKKDGSNQKVGDV